MSESEKGSAHHALERELRIKQQVAFAAGVFQEDITVRTLLEAVAEGVVVVDSYGIILLVNSRVARMFGYEREELVGKPHSILVPQRLHEVHEEYQQRYFENPVTRTMGHLLNLVAVHKDGSEFPVDISLGALETTRGVLVFALITDLTERKQAERALKHAEELARIHVACMRDYAIFMLDTAGNIITWNAGAELLKGYTAEEIVGQHFSCLYTPEDREAGRPARNLDEAQRVGRAEDEGWRVRKDGSRFWANVIISALRDDDGSLRGFSKVTRDMTERKKADDLLRLSESRYRALFNDNPTMIVTVDKDFKILSVNPACCRELGYCEDELTGASVVNLFHENDREAVAGRISACLEHPEEAFHWQFRKVRKDGVALWVEETARAIADLDGNLSVLIVCQDVTEREHLLWQLEAVLDSINEGVVISDLEGRIVRVNKAARGLHQHVPTLEGSATLSQLADLIELRDMAGNVVPFREWPLARAIRGERFVDCEIKASRKDTGETFLESVSGGPVETKEGEAVLAVVTGRDITERKRMEEDLRVAKAQLEQRVAERTAELTATFTTLQVETQQRQRALQDLQDKEQMLIQQGRMAAMGEMIGFIAHQWRQPLNTLGLIVQEIPIYFKQGAVTQQYLEESAAKARDLIAHMSRTIDDFRNFFKAEKQKVPFSVNQVVARALNLVTARFGDQQTAVHLLADQELEVEGYPNEFSQAVLNILVNISDVFSERKIERPEVVIRIFTEGGKSVITIADNAGGIDTGIIDRIFDAYFTTKDPEKGTGLGLYMAKTIIEKNMGGTLTVTNTANGAEFRIEV